MHKIRSSAGLPILALAVLALVSVNAAAAQSAGVVSGRVTLLEKDDRVAQDVDQAVVWLTGPHASAAEPATVEMATENKQFVPRLIMVPVGSTVTFPNHDPFNHNVFSLSPEQPFDLGLYGRGGAKSVTFPNSGVIRVFCNVHAQMRAIVVVRETAFATQPGEDGSFHLGEVPPGEYVLHAWHERAPEITQPIRIGAGAVAPLTLTLDARGYRFVQHKDKNGKSYGDRSRRY
jgi:plastocyanin